MRHATFILCTLTIVNCAKFQGYVYQSSSESPFSNRPPEIRFKFSKGIDFTPGCFASVTEGRYSVFFFFEIDNGLKYPIYFDWNKSLIKVDNESYPASLVSFYRFNNREARFVFTKVNATETAFINPGEKLDSFRVDFSEMKSVEKKYEMYIVLSNKQGQEIARIAQICSNPEKAYWGK